MLPTPSMGPGPAPAHIAEAIHAAGVRLGHRPAITQLLPSGRQEQSGASLAQWAAKGAHLLEVDHGLTVGDRILLAGPAGWPTAAVALAAWWAGVAVAVTPAAGIEVAIVHPEVAIAWPDGDSGAPSAPWLPDTYWIGDAIDGAPPAGTIDRGEAWTHAAQPFPDRPPTTRAAPDAVAVVAGDRVYTQSALLALASSMGDDAPLGLEAPGSDPVLDLALLALRPLLTGRPTVVVRGVPRDTAHADRVGGWR